LRNKTTVLRVVTLVALVAIVGAACSKSTTGSSKKTVKIAEFGAFTGPVAQLVIPGYQGAKLAFDQANAGKFGALPVTIQFTQEDTTGSGTVIPPIAKKVSQDPSFIGVVGPNFSGESLAGGPIFNSAGIPFVTASATKTAINQNHWAFWFRANGNDDEQGPAGGDYIAKILKPNCAFVTSDDSPYGTALAGTVQTTITNDGGTVQAQINAVQTSNGSVHPTDFSALVTKIQSSGCKAVYYGGYDAEAGLLRSQMTSAGLSDVTLVGGDGIEDTTYATEAKASGESTVATCPCGDINKSTSPDAQAFVKDYTAKWGVAPGIYSGEYYDVARLYINAIKAGNITRTAIKNYLEKVNYVGLTKTYSFQENHELVPSDVKIFYWKDVNQTFTYLGESSQVLAAG
jgi:branched-chain amino acid transport system substrate-binding protein